MDVLIARLKPVVDAIDRLTEAVVESNRLRSLGLQAQGLTTHITTATKEQLSDTRVSYNDPEWVEALEFIERAKGRPLDDEELEQAMAAWTATVKDEEQAKV